MKRILALILCAAAACALCACGAKQPADTEAAPTATPDPDSGMAVLDKDGNRLGTISRLASPTITDRGIFYTVTPESGFGTAEYRLYDPATGEDRLLGVMEEQSYETLYCRTELDGRLYTAALTGDLMDGKPDTLWLLSIDLVKGGLEKHKVDENGFPYAYVAAVDGKVLILEHDQQDDLFDRIMELDPAAGELTEAICLKLDGGAQNGDTARAICENDGKLNVLRVHFENGVTSLYIDSYDAEHNKTGERDITELASDAITQILTPDDVQSELPQMVCGFAVEDGFVYYANFSATHFLAELETGRQLTDMGELFNASMGCGRRFYYRIMAEEGQDDIFELENGELTGKRFAAREGYYLSLASAAPNGDRIIIMNADAAAEKQPVLYYLHG